VYAFQAVCVLCMCVCVCVCVCEAEHPLHIQPCRMAQGVHAFHAVPVYIVCARVCVRNTITLCIDAQHYNIKTSECLCASTYIQSPLSPLNPRTHTHAHTLRLTALFIVLNTQPFLTHKRTHTLTHPHTRTHARTHTHAHASTHTHCV